MKCTKNESGSITLLSLLFAIVIIVIGIAFNQIVRMYLDEAFTFKISMESDLQAKSLIEEFIYCFLNGNVTNDSVLLNCKSFPQSIKLNSDITPLKDNFYISIQDTNGLFSLTYLNVDGFKRLLINECGYDYTKAESFIESFLDWQDTDDFKRPNGGEKFDYSVDNKPLPRNYQIQYKSEILFIKNMDEKCYNKIKNFITYFPNYGYNPNTSPKEVLKAYLNLDEDGVKKLLEYIKNKPIYNDSELFAVSGRKIVFEEGLYFYPNRYFIVRIYKKFDEKVVKLYSFVINKNPNLNFPYEIIFTPQE